jgi:hypothetical protein
MFAKTDLVGGMQRWPAAARALTWLLGLSVAAPAQNVVWGEGSGTWDCPPTGLDPGIRARTRLEPATTAGRQC